MRAATAVSMVMAAALALCALYATAQPFAAAPAATPASRSASRVVPAPPVEQVEGAAAAPGPRVGVWCIGGLAAAAAVAASARGRGSAKVRGSVACRVGKAANLIAQRLEEAVRVSADFEKSMADLRAKNELMMREVEAKKAKAEALAKERDELKAQLTALVEQIDSALMGPLKHSAEMATELTSLKAPAAPAPAAPVAVAAAPAPTPAPAPAAAAAAPAPAVPAAVPASAVAREAPYAYARKKSFFPLPWPDTGDFYQW